METSRKRIIHFIEKQAIKPSDFLKNTGLKKGFIDKSHQNSGASDIYLSKILECYPELSAEWLLTGNGEMLTTHSVTLSHEKKVKNENQDTTLSDLIQSLKQTISSQKETIDSQKETIQLHQRVIELLHAKAFPNRFGVYPTQSPELMSKFLTELEDLTQRKEH